MLILIYINIITIIKYFFYFALNEVNALYTFRYNETEGTEKSGSYNIHQMLGAAKAILTRLRCNVNKLILTFLESRY